MWLHDSMIRRVQCKNVALHVHENAAPWPQGFSRWLFSKKKFFKDVWQGSKYTSGPLVWEAMLQQLISVQTVDLNEKTIKLKIET